jgi:hypothetical protein
MANRNACRMHMEKTHRVFNKVKTLEEILGVKDKLGKSGNFSGFLFSFEKIYFV